MEKPKIISKSFAIVILKWIFTPVNKYRLIRYLWYVVICTFFTLRGFAAVQATYYVSPSGNDSNSGTEAQPFATIRKACDVILTINDNMTGDIIIYIRGGWYMLSSPLTFNQTISGTNGYNVIFSAYHGESPVISGGLRITGWKVHDAGKNIWMAPARDLNTRQLYVNCVRAVRAHKGSGLPGAVKTLTGYTTTDQNMMNWGNKSDIEFVYNGYLGGTTGALWQEVRCGVASISGTTITMKTPCWTNIIQPSNYGQQVTDPTDIENAYELLDQPGEWYLDRSAGVIFYIPFPGEDLSNACVIAPVLETLISASGTILSPLHNIQFNAITFAHATWLTPSGNEGFPEVQANYCNGNIGWPPANIVFKVAQDLRFEGCIFEHLGGAIGVSLAGGCQNNEIVGCCFRDISGNGINIGSSDDPGRADIRARDIGNKITDCYIHDVCCEYRGGVGIFCGYVSDVHISHNEICNIPYSAISCGWGWGTNSYAQNNKFTNNNIHHFCMSLADGGAIYTLSSQPGTKWNNNWFHDMPSRVNGGAIYPDEASANMEIYQNVCSNIGRYWLFISPSTVNNINIFDNFTDTNVLLNNGTNCPVTNTTLTIDGNWPQAAIDIMNNTGIESPYDSIKTITGDCSSCFDTSTGTKTNAALLEIIVYPNPFSNFLNVVIPQEIILKGAVMEIYNLCVEEIRNIPISNHETSINRDGLESGIYLYAIINKNMKIANGKLVVQ